MIDGIARLESAGHSLLGQAAHLAFVYTLPLVESATARTGLLEAGGSVGSFQHMGAPTTPASQRITTPNNDTVNSRAWIDLAKGPVRLTWPASGGRYLSIAMIDMYSNNFAILGTRTTGPDGGSVLIVGPTEEAPLGAIRSPTRWMWLIMRILTTGGADLDQVRAIQQGTKLEGNGESAAPEVFAGRNADWASYFDSAGRLMVENPGPAMDAAILRRMEALRLDRFEADRFSGEEGDEIAFGLESAMQLLRAESVKGLNADGWTYPRPNLGNFGQDYFYRAQTALKGFAALPVDEAIYAAASGPSGNMTLDSSHAWRLRLSGAQLPPTDAFWSLVIYRATKEGQFRLFDNPINRYSIGDRMPGLRRDADGGVDIVMQRHPLAESVASNWLPTPRADPFALVFRVYLPGESVRNGSWRLPAIEPR